MSYGSCHSAIWSTTTDTAYSPCGSGSGSGCSNGNGMTFSTQLKPKLGQCGRTVCVPQNGAELPNALLGAQARGGKGDNRHGHESDEKEGSKWRNGGSPGRDRNGRV